MGGRTTQLTSDGGVQLCEDASIQPSMFLDDMAISESCSNIVLCLQRLCNVA